MLSQIHTLLPEWTESSQSNRRPQNARSQDAKQVNKGSERKA
jgi:hypothetical protein